MSDYIKREDAENIMLGSCDESALWKLRYLPSADVVEVRHGHWKCDDGFTCSECGYHMVVGDGAYNYCPNCGARMDGEEE